MSIAFAQPQAFKNILLSVKGVDRRSERAPARISVEAAFSNKLFSVFNQVHIALGLQPTEINVAWATTQPQCFFLAADAVSCSPSGIARPDQDTCEAAGCCFNDNAGMDFSCFQSDSLDAWLCRVPEGAKRERCVGVQTNTSGGCLAAGCCWSANQCHATRADLSVDLSYHTVGRESAGARASRVVKSDVRLLNITNAGSRFTHTATLTDLEPDTEYEYTIAGHPKKFTFTHRRPSTQIRCVALAQIAPPVYRGPCANRTTYSLRAASHRIANGFALSSH